MGVLEIVLAFFPFTGVSITNWSNIEKTEQKHEKELRISEHKKRMKDSSPYG